MKFSVLFWNIWLDNQLGGREHADKLLDELNRFVDEYQPDCFGLSEVLQHVDAKTPFVLDHLQALGYRYSHFASSSPLTDEWLIGTAICSKHKLSDKQDIILDKDIPAEHRGYKGWDHKSVAARAMLKNGVSVGIITTHLTHLRSYTIRSHYAEQQALLKFIQNHEYPDGLVVGGDFNEPRWFPRSFKHLARRFLKHRTGTLRDHTWHHNASSKTLVRANLDRLFWLRSASLHLENFSVLKSSVSDHKPLLAEFRLKK